MPAIRKSHIECISNTKWNFIYKFTPVFGTIPDFRYYIYY